MSAQTVVDPDTSPAAAWKSLDKRHFVMAHALELLSEIGYQGLTMRGLAERCGMSLSNVQYYFKAKEDLIAEIADRYFGYCGDILTDHLAASGPIKDRASLEQLVALFLDHGEEMNDMCRVFRELWAIGSRNDVIAERLRRHYAGFGDTLAGQIQLSGMHAASEAQVIALLLILSEGYSVVGPTRGLSHEETIVFATDMLLAAAQRTA